MILEKIIERLDNFQEDIKHATDVYTNQVEAVLRARIQPAINWICREYSISFDAETGVFLNGEEMLNPYYKKGFPEGADDAFRAALFATEDLLNWEFIPGKPLHRLLRSYSYNPPEELPEGLPAAIYSLQKMYRDTGRVVRYGKHANATGYYVACAFPNQLLAWADAGHGHTLEEAAEHALAMHRGEIVCFRSSSEFDLDKINP